MNTNLPMYDPAKTYDDNFDNGPFGDITNNVDSDTTNSATFSFLGFQLNSPFGIPAGPLLNGKYVSAALNSGFDVVCYKTQRSVPFGVNEFPNVLYVNVDGDLTIEKASQPLVGKTTPSDDPKKLTITNSFGNPSRGPEFWVNDLKNCLTDEQSGQLVIMSVVGTIKDGSSHDDYYQDFADTARLATDTGVKAVEINLSCPNVANEGILCYTPDAVEAICQKTRQAIGNTPLIAKIGYFTTEQENLLRSVVQKMSPYVNAISAINTIPAPIVDEKGNQALPGQNRLSSGMCGASIKWAGIEMVSRLKKIRDQLGLNFEIVGVGGVMNPDDFHQYIDAGASIVQSATGAMWNAHLAQEIKASL